MEDIKALLFMCAILLTILNLKTCEGNSNITNEIHELRMEIKP